MRRPYSFCEADLRAQLRGVCSSQLMAGAAAPSINGVKWKECLRGRSTKPLHPSILTATFRSFSSTQTHTTWTPSSAGPPSQTPQGGVGARHKCEEELFHTCLLLVGFYKKGKMWKHMHSRKRCCFGLFLTWINSSLAHRSGWLGFIPAWAQIHSDLKLCQGPRVLLLVSS